MDITYKPYIRDSAFQELSIKKPTINISGYKPKYTVEQVEEDIVTPVESQIEEIRAPEPQVKRTTTNIMKFKSKKEFKDTMTPIYEALLVKRGLNPAFAKALVAQDGLESAWGSKPTGSFNFGGIKGKGSIKRTREVINGKDVYINDSFRDFNSLEDYANYKINLLNNSRYQAFSGDVSEFANRVYKGGYATDPNYSKVLNNIITSAKQGGVLKFQQGGIAQGKEWVKNWYKNRRPQIKNNIQQNQRIPFPVTGTLGYNILTHNMDLTTASVDPSKVPADAKGVYYPRGRRIYLKEDSPSTAVHEWVHGSNPDPQVKQIKKIKNILGDSLYDQKSVVPDDYLDDPQEIYSRLMQFRYALGVDPNHEFTNEEIEALKRDRVKQETLTNRLKGKKSNSFSTTTFDKNGKVIDAEPFNPEYKYIPEESTSHREYDETDTFNILNRYSTDGVRRLLNDVAQVPKKRDTTIYVQEGIKMPDIWTTVLPEQMRPQSTNPNWRAPLLPLESNKSTSITIEDEYGNKLPLAKQYYNQLIQLGANPFQAAGIVGVLMKESSLDHTQVSSKGAKGIAQLLGNKYKSYQNYIKRNNLQDTAETQINWLWDHINKGKDEWQDYYDALSNHANSNWKGLSADARKKEESDWNSMKSSKWVNYSYNNLRNTWNDIKSAGDIAELFTWTFERPGEKEADIIKRRKYAEDLYNIMNNK